MPAKSAKQYKFMQMIAHNKKKMNSAIGPSQKVAEEMIHKTPKGLRSQFMKGNK